MADDNIDELTSLLNSLPEIEFCCVYGSCLHKSNVDKSTMVDFILGVRDPLQWHGENLKMNRAHYASWISCFGGARLITRLADDVGVGVHFNPYIVRDDKMFKYGVVGVNYFIQDLLKWERFYLSGRLQKPVRILVDALDLGNLNLINLRAATAVALLLLPPKFTEDDLYAKICGLSYKGDLRMLFAEDRHKVRKIVQGQFCSFQRMYKPVLEEFKTRDLFRFSSFGGCQTSITQDCSLSSTQTLFAFLPANVRNGAPNPSREEAGKNVEKAVRRRVMSSSARQAVSGLLATGVCTAAKYGASKVYKACKSRIN